MSALVPLEVRSLIRRAASFVGVSEADLIGPCRTDQLARARFAVMLELRDMGWSYPRIARVLGRRDHTTVMHGVKQARLLMSSTDYLDADFIGLVDHLRAPAPPPQVRPAKPRHPNAAAPYFPYNHPTMAGTYDDVQHRSYIERQREYSERCRVIRAAARRKAG